MPVANVVGFSSGDGDILDRKDLIGDFIVIKLDPKDLLPRCYDGAREVRPSHVLDLMESISAIGLIQDPVLDKDGRVIAGTHRAFAMRILSTPINRRAAVWSEIFGRRITASESARLRELPFDCRDIYVKLLQFDSALEVDRARAIEMAENNARRNVSKAEFRKVYDAFKVSPGYVRTTGRPKRGERAILPAVCLALGISRTHAYRLMRAEENTPNANSVRKSQGLLPNLISLKSKKGDTMSREETNLLTWMISQLTHH